MSLRLLVLSVGNTSLFGGVFAGKKLGATFRAPLKASEKVGQVIPRPPAGLSLNKNSAPSSRTKNSPAFLRSVRGTIDRAVLCSVVPALTTSIARAIEHRHDVRPELLTADSPHGLEIGYEHPRTLGTDRLAAALGARALFPKQHVIVVDCGTATTVTALHRDGVLLGGAIFPGLALWPELLAARTAQLPRVAFQKPTSALGRSTKAGIASGIFHGHAGAIRELVARIRGEAFGRAPVLIVGTGGHAPRFADEKLFTALEPALVLHGLRAFAERALST